MGEPSRADFAHFLPITVKWGEMDSLGHVNNTVFFRYAEDGRIDYCLELMGRDTQFGQAATGPIMADLRCRFLQQLRYPADVEIATRVIRIGGASLGVEQALFLAGSDELIAVYDTVLVWFDFVNQKSRRLPEATRERIRALEPVAPAE